MKQVHQISIDKIIVPHWAEREPNTIQDDLLLKSIEKGRIQQPLALVRDGNDFLLAKGTRRLRAARRLGITKVPAVIEVPPRGKTAEDHARRLRFILDHHRQDLLPSQKAELVETLKSRFGMSNREVAAYLGIVPDSVTNWIAVRNYIPEVVQELDAGILTGNRARVFDGMTPEGQRAVWKKHRKALHEDSPKMVHKMIRERYAPAANPSYYSSPEVQAARIARKQGPRRSRKQPELRHEDKKRLSDSLELREIELRSGTAELATLKAEIRAAIVPVGAIMRNPEILAALPAGMKEEFERFAEVYV